NFINFENGIHKKISGPLYTQTDAVIDENAGLTYLLSAGCENSKCEISLYKSAIDKTPDITKSPLWTVSSSQIGLQGSPASIKFVSPKEFIIQGNYSDSAVVAKSFNLDGKLTSVFDISFQIRQEGFYPLGYSVHKFNNDWYLSGNNYGYWP